MKCLTLTEPWASLVACGAKTIETRDWYTSHRGQLAIHAAKGMTGNDLDAAIYSDEVFRALPETRNWWRYRPKVKDAFTGTRGQVIAFTEVLDCIPTHEVGFRGSECELFTNGAYRHETDRREQAFGNFALGRWAWILGDVYRLRDPIPATGALGLWEFALPDDAATERVTFEWNGSLL